MRFNLVLIIAKNVINLQQQQQSVQKAYSFISVSFNLFL